MSFDHCDSSRLGTLASPASPGSLSPFGDLNAGHRAAAARLTSLTTREREVLGRIADGQSTSQIAKELAIASSTARTHASNVLMKLGARSRIQAVATASPPPPLIAEPPPEPDPLAALTRREREVLACMVEGLTQAATAERLCLSPHTVRTHARNILSKLGVHSILEAAALVRRLTTGPPEPNPATNHPAHHRHHTPRRAVQPPSPLNPPTPYLNPPARPG